LNNSIYTFKSESAFRIEQSKNSYVKMKLVMDKKMMKIVSWRSREISCEQRRKKFRIFNIFLLRVRWR